MREDVSVLAKKSRFDQHFDISLPIPVIEKEVQIATKKLKNYHLLSMFLHLDM